MISLKAQLRELKGRKTKKIKEQGLIPAVVYGHNFKSKSIQVLSSDFKKVFKETGESILINLEIEEAKPIKVLVYDLQHHPLKDNIQHIDFYKIKEGEKIKVETGLKFVNEAPAVKELGGIIFHNLNKVEIECLPEYLIHEIEVDMSVLKTFEDIIRIKDLIVPSEVKIIDEAEEMVVQVERPKEEVVEEKSLEEEEAEAIEEKLDEEKEKPKEEGKQEEAKK